MIVADLGESARIRAYGSLNSICTILRSGINRLTFSCDEVAEIIRRAKSVWIRIISYGLANPKTLNVVLRGTIG